MLNDRTVTIRASVADVEFELMLAIALVVMVIFVFLRNVPATIIPAVAVPLSLVGAFGVMYLTGFSINNLTLMALTIATGFVVDDAIVMIENIARYIEDGEAPMAAALKGSKQIGFTIISLTISLIAVLIPLLFMGDVVGRLFREFAVTLAVSILISAFISLTLTPMMCARLLKHVPEDKQGRFYHASGQFFDRVIARYGRMLSWVLERQRLTLLVALATLALTAALYVLVPKGFFPLQDTGAIQGVSEAAQSTSFGAMARQQEALARQLLTPGGGKPVLLHRRGRQQRRAQQRPAADQPQAQGTARRHPYRAGPAARPGRRGAGHGALSAASAYPTIDSRVSRTQYQFTLQATSAEDPSAWTPKLVSAAPAAAVGRCGQRLAGQGPAGLCQHQPRHRRAAGRHHRRHRQRALRRLRPAADLHHLHPDQPIPRGAGSTRSTSKTRYR